MKKYLIVLLVLAFSTISLSAQDKTEDTSAKAESVIAAVVAKLGGEKYKAVTSVSSTGKFSIVKERKIMSFQSFVDVLLYPDKQRTDFSERGSKTVQVNTGETGWIYDDFLDKFGPQTDLQIEGFTRGMRTHYDYLLRGSWKGLATLSYEGRRPASIGKRNDVLRLTFPDGFSVEYEFSDKALPAKTVYSTLNREGISIPNENRYAQYILTDGILFPFIIDHFSDGKRSYRVNYIKVRFNQRIDDSIFEKPDNPKKIKKLKI